MNPQPPAGWFPDPFGRYEQRYWDGVQWTEHVWSGGLQTTDAPTPAPPVAPTAQQPQAAVAVPSSSRVAPVNKKVQKQVRGLGVADSTHLGGGTLFTEQVLVVNQKAKLFERRAEYTVFDQYGRKLGSIRQFGVSMSKVVVGRDNATKRLQVLDANGRPLLTLTRPATMWKSKVTVMRADGTPVGLIAQESLGVMASVLGGKFNVRFRMEAGGIALGTINAEDWRAWDFSIQDPHGAEIARITKTWAGFGKESFTKADNYVLEMHRILEDPLLTLVVSAALVVDTVLKQSSDGDHHGA